MGKLIMILYVTFICSVVQFCSKAFAVYAQATVVQEIFGHTLESLRGIKYLFKYGITHCLQSASIYLSLFVHISVHPVFS